MSTGGPFPGGKTLPGRDAGHSPPSSAEVMNEELYVLSPQAPTWRVAGLLQFYLSIYIYRRPFFTIYRSFAFNEYSGTYNFPFRALDKSEFQNLTFEIK
jgi:hypothetical protein